MAYTPSSRTYEGKTTSSTTGGITQDQADLRYLKLSGGTLSGVVNLSNQYIVTDTSLVNKKYVDDVGTGSDVTLDFKFSGNKQSVESGEIGYDNSLAFNVTEIYVSIIDLNGKSDIINYVQSLRINDYVRIKQKNETGFNDFKVTRIATTNAQPPYKWSFGVVQVGSSIDFSLNETVSFLITRGDTSGFDQSLNKNDAVQFKEIKLFDNSTTCDIQVLSGPALTFSINDTPNLLITESIVQFNGLLAFNEVDPNSVPNSNVGKIFYNSDDLYFKNKSEPIQKIAIQNKSVQFEKITLIKDDFSNWDQSSSTGSNGVYNDNQLTVSQQIVGYQKYVGYPLFKSDSSCDFSLQSTVSGLANTGGVSTGGSLFLGFTYLLSNRIAGFCGIDSGGRTYQDGIQTGTTSPFNINQDILFRINDGTFEVSQNNFNIMTATLPNTVESFRICVLTDYNETQIPFTITITSSSSSFYEALTTNGDIVSNNIKILEQKTSTMTVPSPGQTTSFNTTLDLPQNKNVDLILTNLQNGLLNATESFVYQANLSNFQGFLLGTGSDNDQVAVLTYLNRFGGAPYNIKVEFMLNNYDTSENILGFFEMTIANNPWIPSILNASNLRGNLHGTNLDSGLDGYNNQARSVVSGNIYSNTGQGISCQIVGSSPYDGSPVTANTKIMARGVFYYRTNTPPPSAATTFTASTDSKLNQTAFTDLVQEMNLLGARMDGFDLNLQSQESRDFGQDLASSQADMSILLQQGALISNLTQKVTELESRLDSLTSC